MTPDEQAMLNELYTWFQQKQVQQLDYPVDDASAAALNAASVPLLIGAGSTPLTQVYTDSHGDTVTAPRAFAQSFVIIVNGQQYEVPSLS